ncbi:toll-like receptor 2 [Ptychodera flava]|uniref:toll-like receptor 2 n=1 Tax=Ptychodera flava TaxID=63121 RepID=UPI003969BF72
MDFLKVVHFFLAACHISVLTKFSCGIPAWKVFNNTHVHYNAAWCPTLLGQDFFDTLPSSLTHLTIIDGGISIVTNSTFGKLSKLEELLIVSNKITDINSNAFCNQGHLKTLSLKKNANFLEAGTDCKHGHRLILSPQMLNGLSALITLDLSYFGLGNTALGKDVLEPLERLEELLLGGNCFTDVDEDAFDHLTNLKILNLSYSQIEQLKPNTFSKLSKLKELYLSPSRLKKIPNDALAVPNLEVLYLGGKFMGNIEFKGNFNNKSKLKEFAMNGCYPSSNSRTTNCVSLNITNTSYKNLRTGNFLFHQNRGLTHTGLKNLLSFPPECENLYLGRHDGLIGRVLSPAYFQASYERIRNIKTLTFMRLGIIGIDNDTFVNFTNLRVLILSHNQLVSALVAENAFGGLKELRKLDLSFNALTEVPNLNYFNTESCKLTKVNLIGNQFETLRKDPFKSLCNIESLYLSQNLVGDSSAVIFRNMTGLKDLELSGNRFFQLANLVDELSSLTNLVSLDLTGNELVEGQYKNTSSLSQLHQLKRLKLSDYGTDLRLLINVRSIEELHLVNPQGYDMVLSWKKYQLFFPNIHILHISGSRMSLDRDMLSSMPKLTNLELPNNRIDALDRDAFVVTCTSPSSPRGVMLVRDFDPSTLVCRSLTHVYLAVGLALFATLAAVIVAMGVYYRWHIKYAIFLIRCKVNGYTRIPEPEKDYDAFISFNSGDEQWVQHTLVPHLEENCNTQFKICVHYKDFIPGKAIIDNILDSIENSRKTVLVLSPNFVKSEWCHFEMQMAHHRLFEDRRDVVVLLSLEPIPDKDTQRLLRKLLLKRSYITWPKEVFLAFWYFYSSYRLCS